MPDVEDAEIIDVVSFCASVVWDIMALAPDTENWRSLIFYVVCSGLYACVYLYHIKRS